MSDDYPKPIDPPEMLKDLAKAMSGTIGEAMTLPDGSGYATISFPLPNDHWSKINPDKVDEPPMPFRMGEADVASLAIFSRGLMSRQVRLTRAEFAEQIRAAGRFAYRASTMNGREQDLDPDALLQNLIVGLLGFWTQTGLSHL